MKQKSHLPKGHFVLVIEVESPMIGEAQFSTVYQHQF